MDKSTQLEGKTELKYIVKMISLLNCEFIFVLFKITFHIDANKHSYSNRMIENQIPNRKKLKQKK